MRDARVSVPKCHETGADRTGRRYAAAGARPRRLASRDRRSPRSSSPCPRRRTCASRRATSTSCCASSRTWTCSGCWPPRAPRPHLPRRHGPRRDRRARPAWRSPTRSADEFHQTFVHRPLRLAHRRRDRPGRDRRRAGRAGRATRACGRASWRPRDAAARVGRAPSRDADAVFAGGRHAPGRQVRRDPARSPSPTSRATGPRRCPRSTPGPATPAGGSRWCAFYEASAPVLLRPDPELNAPAAPGAQGRPRADGRLAPPPRRRRALPRAARASAGMAAEVLGEEDAPPPADRHDARRAGRRAQLSATRSRASSVAGTRTTAGLAARSRCRDP